MDKNALTTKDYIDIAYYVLYLIVVAVTAWYIYRSLKTPIDAVKVGRQLNDEQERDERKRNLFLTLFAYRGMPNHFKFVEALNQIEILYHEQPQILQAWYNLYNSMNIGDRQETQHDRNTWDDLRVLLLDEMSSHLNYSSLKQLRIKKAYYPKGYQEHENLQLEERIAQLKYHQLGADVYQRVIDKSDEENQLPAKPAQPH